MQLQTVSQLATQAVSVKRFGEFSFLQLSLQLIISLHTETITETIPLPFFTKKNNILTANPPVFYFFVWSGYWSSKKHSKINYL